MLRWLALAVVAMLAGCKGCGEDKPYTPFGVASAIDPVPVPSASVAELPDAADAPKLSRQVATAAPPGATRWSLAGRSLTAPPGRAFERGLAADLDADATVEVVAWTVPAETAARGGQPPAPGELWLYPASGEARRLLQLPGFVPGGPGCRHRALLAQTGARSVTLDVTAECDAKLLARSPKRALLVVAPLAERPTVLVLRVAEPAPGETLRLDVDSTDRDADGRDDVRLLVSVARQGSKRPAAAELVWFDRAAGVSRDATQPAGSIARAASIALTRAKSKKNAESVPELVENIRRLLSTVCAESGVPRLFDADGAPIACGKLSVTVDRLAMAELTAALTRSDPVAAAGALLRDGWYFGKASDKIAKQMASAFVAAATRVEASLTQVAARPVTQPEPPRFSPLTFEGSGALLVQTAAGVVRVSRDGREESLGEGGQAPWPLEVRSDGGARWAGVAHACDRNEVLLTLQAPAGAPAAEPIVTGLLAPRPGSCRGGAAPKAPPPAPLVWKTNGLEAIVAGAHVGPLTSVAEATLRPQPLGTPRSPDGRLLALPTPLGVLVSGVQKTELWQAAALPAAHALSDCTVANGAAALACVGEGRALLLVRP